MTDSGIYNQVPGASYTLVTDQFQALRLTHLRMPVTGCGNDSIISDYQYLESGI
jgi:hypothetical protein